MLSLHLASRLMQGITVTTWVVGLTARGVGRVFRDEVELAKAMRAERRKYAPPAAPLFGRTDARE